MKENQIAIQNGLRNEIAENFMNKLKDLFTESYIEVPESKVDLVDELAESVEELETKLNETTQKVIDTTEELEVYKRDTIIHEASRDLADTQVEKLKTLVSDIVFDNEETFAEKVETVKESYFKKEVVETSDDTIMESDEPDTVEISDQMSRYVDAVKKITPKKLRKNKMESYDRLIEKWSPVLNEESAGKIQDNHRKAVTFLLFLKNQEQAMMKEDVGMQGFLTENAAALAITLHLYQL